MISLYPKPGAQASANYPFLHQPVPRFLDLAYFIRKYTWSPIIFKDSTRQEANFESAVLIGLDFDDGMTLSEAIENVFCDMRHIIGTTRSHQKPKGNKRPCDRFRVILQLEQRLTSLRDYKWNFEQAIKHYESDKNAAGGSRLFFPCDKIVSYGDGYLLDVQKPPVNYMNPQIWEEKARPYREAGIVPRWLRAKLNGSVREGQRNPTFFGIAADLKRYGLSHEEVLKTILESPACREHQDDRHCIAGIIKTIDGIFRRNYGGK